MSLYSSQSITDLLATASPSSSTTFPWCSGYHIRLTRGRSPVRARAETIIIPCGLVARIAGFHPAGPGSIPGMGNYFIARKRITCALELPISLYLTQIMQSFFSFNFASVDEVAEWLRRWTANPMCSARVGSNPILVGICFVYLAFNSFVASTQGIACSLHLTKTARKSIVSCPFFTKAFLKGPTGRHHVGAN